MKMKDMKENKIIVIGSYISALVMNTETIPMIGETVKGYNFRQTFGGKGSNQAVQAVRLGADVTFVTKVGNDDAGEAFKELCRAEGISHNYIYTDDILPTATGFIICSSEGQNIITIDIAVLNNITREEIDQALVGVQQEDVVLLQLEIDPDIAFYAATKAKEKGAIVILNPAPATDLHRYDLSVIDYLTPNETEARICVGLAPDCQNKEEDLASMLVDMGCGNVIVTLGENGSLLHDGNEIQYYSPFVLERTVDSTGAGDAFNAGLATALSEGMDVCDGIPFASAVAALACTKHDTIPSYETRENVIKFMTKYSG